MSLRGRLANLLTSGYTDTELPGDIPMPRYMVERDFPAGLHIPQNDEGSKVCRIVVDNNATDDVTWVHSYVSLDKKRTYCIYDAPTPEAIRRVATKNNLPVAHITEVMVLDPYFYR